MEKKFIFNSKFTKFITLSVLGMLGAVGTILVDTFFISQKLGPLGLAALNIALPVYGVLNGLGLMFGIGGATYYSISRAQSKKEQANNTYTTSLFIACIAGVIIWLVGLLAAEKISYLLGANSETIALCRPYLKVILCFGPWFILNHVFISFIRNDGNAHLPMAAMLIGNLANIVLDYLFMYPFHMGIFGSALATGLAPILGIMTSSIYYWTKSYHFHLHRIQYSLISKIASLGFTSFVNEFSSGIVILVFNILILKVSGNMGVAVYGIVANYALIILAVFTGISQGTQPLVSESYGKGDYQMANRLYRSSLLVSLLFGAGVFIIFFIFASPLATVFNSEHNAILQQMAIKGMRLYFIGFMISGYNIITSVFFSATEKARLSSIISTMRGLIGIIIVAVIMAIVFHLNGIWLAFPVTELMTALLVHQFIRRYPLQNSQ